MKTLPAILTTLGLLSLCWAVEHFSGKSIMWPMIIGTSIWVAVDAAKLKVYRYKTFVSYSPVLLFVLSMLLWIITFPAYLIGRGRILRGEAAVNEKPLPVYRPIFRTVGIVFLVLA